MNLLQSKISKYLLVGISVSILMISSEFLKHSIFPEITIWKSYIVTVVFTTVLSIFAALIISKRLEKIVVERTNNLQETNEKLKKKITENEIIIKVLLEKEEKYRELTENLNDVIFSTDTDGKITYVSPIIENILGYTPDELIDTEFTQLVNPDDLKAGLQPVKDVVYSKPRRVEYQYRMQKKDGSFCWVRISSRPIRHGDKIDGMQGVIADITQQKRIEEDLKRSEKQYRDLVENINDIIFSTNAEGVYTYVSPSVEKILDYTSDELIGLPVEDILHPEDREKRRHKIKKFLQGQIYPTDYRMRTKSGEYRWVRASSRPIHEGELYVGNKGVLTDITEQKWAEEEKEKLQAQLLQAHKMEAIGTLAGGIAHEFNNILGIIIGNNEIAIDHIPEWSPARECIKEIRTASIRAKDVVRQILSFARKSYMERKPVEISPVIEDTLRLLRSSIPKSIDIRYEAACELDVVLADPTHINQILMNLCTNAYQAMSGEDGCLTVTLNNVGLKRRNNELNLKPGRYVKLTVKDTGQGINPKIMDRIFDPYFTTKGLAEGTGMGLAVVHGIVQNYDGAITAESKPGEGSVFEVFLPCIEAEVLEEIEKEEILPTGDECILFVDDEEGLVKAYTRGLKDLDYDVVSFSGPLQALEAFQKNPERFDLVITDMAMPKLSGDQLAKKMVAIRSDIPVILCTGYSERVSENEAEAMGIKAFLLKPLIKKDLARTVRNVLDEIKMKSHT